MFTTGDGTVLRGLTAEGLADWRRLAGTRFFPELVAEGKVVGTELLDDPPALPEYEAALRHEVVPFVSYPYEWCFGMLKDAALLQLELVARALDEEMILKDSSPYNVQWRGARPVFVDVGSFEPHPEGEPWVGYRQFCMLFLYPLLLQAWKGVPFNARLRGSIDGIEPQECRSLMSARDLLRRGALAHVVLHARLDRRYAVRDRDVRAELKEAGFNRELIRANVKRLDRLVRGLEWEPRPSVWSEYAPAAAYSDAKAAFVREAAGARSWSLLWDLGCNDGRYTRLAAEHARYAVAVDADAAVVDALYGQLKAEGETSILPLTMNLADPSPGLGWRGRERRPLPDRGRPDLTLCLALLHHLSIAGNVPLRELVDWLRSLDTALVVEFVTKEDPMAQRLLARKRDGTHPDYELDVFQRLLGEAFDVERREALESGTRVLYLARPKV